MSVFDITITANSGSAPNDGFIDPMTVYAYANLDNSNIPTDYAASVAKSRANRRHKWVVLGVMGNSPLHITNTTATGSPSSNAAPATMVYRVDTGGVLIKTADESNGGAIITDAAAIKRLFARTLIRSETLMLEALDPTLATAKGNTLTYARTGPRFDQQTVGPVFSSLANAEAAITVTTV